MTNRIRAGIALLAIGHWLAGCDTATRSPTAPSAPPTSAPAPPVPGGVLGQGTVFDTAFRWVAGARVEVLDGPQAGASAMTGPMGEFSLSGSFDRSTRIRLTRDGYIPEIQPLGVPHAVYHLFVSAPPVNIVGAYTMTFTADATCASLSEELRSRTYQVAITPGTFDPIPPQMVFDLKLAGADILENPSIGVAGDVVGFKLFNDGYPYIVERVATNMHVAITGWAEIANWRLGGSEFAVPFDGWIEYFGPPPSQGRPLVSCQSKSHQLRLTRRRSPLSRLSASLSCEGHPLSAHTVDRYLACSRRRHGSPHPRERGKSHRWPFGAFRGQKGARPHGNAGISGIPDNVVCVTYRI